MPITAFNSFTDGLDPTRRSREHFITNINLEDDRLWVPCANGVWFWTKRNGGHLRVGQVQAEFSSVS